MENLAWVVLAAIASGIGGYFGAYFKRKGENRAMQEDLGRLVAQVKATTDATKRIEATISHEVWNRQRQWELKREALLEGARVTAEFLAAMMKLNSVFSLDEDANNNPVYSAELARHQGEVMSAFVNATYNFQRAQLLVSVVSSLETQTVFVRMEKILKKISSQIVGGNTAIFKELMPLVRTNASAVTNAIRKELALDGEGLTPTPESTESSEAPDSA